MRRLIQISRTYSFESTKRSIWFGACKMRRLNQALCRPMLVHHMTFVSFLLLLYWATCENCELLTIGSFKFPPHLAKMAFKCPTISSDLSVKWQCRSKGDISGGAHERRRRETLGGLGARSPRKFWNLEAWKYYFQRSPRAICDLRIPRIIYFFHCLGKPMHIESITLATSITR